MCRFADQVNHARTNNKSAADAYPVQNQVRPYSEVEPYRCALTGATLSHHYVHNAGKTEKAFHEDVYQWFISEKTGICKFCRQAPLDQTKVAGQHSNPRELSNYLCPECVEYMALLFRKVANRDNSFLLDEQRAQQIAYQPAHQTLPSPTIVDEDVIEAEYVENKPKALPPPPNLLRAKDIIDFGKRYLFGDKEVEYVPIKR